MIKILCSLISFKTITSDQKENKRALRWIEKRIKPYLPVKIFEKNGFSSLVALSRKTKKPKIGLVAHLDVVPGPDSLFTPQIKGNRLIGRGVFDMKFAIACYLQLIEDLKEKVRNYDFGIMITCDEEIGGFNGTKFLITKGFLPKFVFLPDGGENFKIEEGAKGIWHLKVIAKGKSAHGSRPWLGRNPFWELSNFLFEFSQYFPKEPCKDKNHHHNTLNIGKIEGGMKVNVVPNLIEALIDIRLIPEVSKTDFQKIINDLLKKYQNLKIKELVYGSSYRVNFETKEMKIYIEILKKNGLPFKTIFSHGSSDGRFFAAKKIPLLLTRPKGGGHHSEREWIDLPSLERYYRIFKEWFLRSAN